MQKYYYHVTTEENTKEILKNGLIPQIGEHSKIVGETEKAIYLCDKQSVPFWATLLDMPVVLRVSVDENKIDEGQIYKYSEYMEMVVSHSLPACNICRSGVSTELSTERIQDLALSYIDTISLVCVNFARYITYINDNERKQEAQDNYDMVTTTIKAMQFTLPHVNFSLLSAKIVRDHLHEMGDGGYTLCDRYETGLDVELEGLRLYKLLDRHALATDETKWLYKWLKKTFPRRLRVDTGGWTG